MSESTVSNTELSEFFGPYRTPGRKRSEFLSAYYLCAKTNAPSFFFAEFTEFAAEIREFFFRNSTLETVLRNCFLGGFQRVLL